MKAITWLYIVTFLLSLAGCARKNNVSILVSHLDEEKLIASKVIQKDTLKYVDTLIYAKEFLVYQDSVLIVINNKHKDGYFVELYMLPSMEPITKLYKLGNGPNELLSAKVDLNKNQLIVNDYIKAQIAVVDIDSLLKNSDYLAVPIRHQAIGSPTAVPYKGKFLLENPYSFIDEKAGIYQNAPRFIVTDGKVPYIERNKYQYYTRNVAVNGRIIINEEKDRIIYANMYKSTIEIYDMDLNKLKEVEGPFYLNPMYAVEGEEQYNSVSFKGYIPYAYLDYCVDNDYFYLTYIGDKLREGQKMKELSCWIFKFNWDGDLIDCYPINYALSISRSQQENAFYITTLSSDETPLLIKVYEK